VFTLGVLLLAQLVIGESVFGNSALDQTNETRGTPQYHDFPLDNIHILRLQEASRSLNDNVTSLKNDLFGYQEVQTRELAGLEARMTSMQTDVLSQLRAIQSLLHNSQQQNAPQIQYPATISIPPHLSMLLIFNTVLILFVLAALFWFKEQQKQTIQVHDEKYTHVPTSLVDYLQKHMGKKNLHELRMELVTKGWTPSIIEKAIVLAKEDE